MSDPPAGCSPQRVCLPAIPFVAFVTFRAFPLDRRTVDNMISSVRSYPLLLGVRGEAKKDIDAAADTIVKVGAILQSSAEISDIEINPLVVNDEGEGVKAVDVRILLTKSEETK